MPLRDYDAAAPYLHLLMLPSWEGLRGPLANELAAVDPSAGTVVELGAGTGIGTELVLDTVASAPVLALEPSAALRAVLVARLVSHPQAERLTVLPCTAQDAVLPERICVVLGAHMVGHLDSADRRRLWGELASRLAPGAPVLLTAEGPDTPVTIPWFPPIEVRAAGLAYSGTGSAEPDGPDAVHWQMRYTTRSDDGVVLHTTGTAYRYHTVGAEALAAELSDAGLLIATCADGRVFARAPGPVPSRARATGLRERTMLADPGRTGDWRHLLAREAALESGLLEALPGTATDVAARAGLDAHATRAVLGLLAVAGDVVADAGAAPLFRRSSAPDAEQEALTLTHARSLRRWAQVLGPRLHDRTAGPQTPHATPPLRLDTLAAVARPVVGPVVQACLDLLPAGTRALDLGGGHGSFALALAEHGVEVVLQDLPPVVERAAADPGLAGVSTFAGDLRTTLAPGRFGLVLLSTVTNVFDADVNRDLLARVHAALTPGGAVVVVSYLRGRAPVADAFAVQMLCFSDGGDAHDETAYRGWLDAAGFVDVAVTDLDEPPQSIVSAVRGPSLPR